MCSSVSISGLNGATDWFYKSIVCQPAGHWHHEHLWTVGHMIFSFAAFQLLNVCQVWRKVFATLLSVRKMFHYFLKKFSALKEMQALANHPQLNMIKHSDSVKEQAGERLAGTPPLPSAPCWKILMEILLCYASSPMIYPGAVACKCNLWNIQGLCYASVTNATSRGCAMQCNLLE